MADFEISILARGKTTYFVVRNAKKGVLKQKCHDAKHFAKTLTFKAESTTAFFPAGTVQNYWIREIKE